METTLEHARWLGGPLICAKHNLPAFESPELAFEFIEKNCPGAKVIKMGRCLTCGKVHFTSRQRAPSGDSSGTSRR